MIYKSISVLSLNYSVHGAKAHYFYTVMRAAKEPLISDTALWFSLLKTNIS